MTFQQQTEKDQNPVKSFVFTKSSKTGSTTLTSLLIRFVINNKLNIIFPKKKAHIWWDKPEGE